jgi:5-methylcytosine-specific restriction endonuclease McrA
MAVMPKDPRDSRDWRAMRKQILARDGYTCTYCGQPADTVDHVLSVKAHPDLALSPDNLTSACKRCNSRKGSRSEAVFLAQTFTPPIFIDYPSPMRSKVHEDSPFISRPIPEGS